MRRPSGILLAGAIMVLPLFSQHDAAAAPAPAQEQAKPATPPPVNFTGGVVLWAFTINPDKTGDYEQVRETLKAALQTIARREARQRLAGWASVRNVAPRSRMKRAMRASSSASGLV